MAPAWRQLAAERDGPARHGRGLVPGSEATQTSGWGRRCHRETGGRRGTQPPHRWGHADTTPPTPPGHRAQLPAAAAPGTGGPARRPDTSRVPGHRGGPKYPHMGVCVGGCLWTPPSPLLCWESQLSIACARTHLGRCRGAPPSHTHTMGVSPRLAQAWGHCGGASPSHTGARRRFSSLANPPTPICCCPLCALPLALPPFLADTHPAPPPRESPGARPAPADTNGKSPPVTASWQALSEGFRVPQPAPRHGHLLPAPCGGSGRQEDPPPSPPPPATPSSVSPSPRHPKAHGSCSLLFLLAPRHPACAPTHRESPATTLPASGTGAPISTRGALGSHLKTLLGTHPPWGPTTLRCHQRTGWEQGKRRGSGGVGTGGCWGTGCLQAALSPPSGVTPLPLRLEAGCHHVPPPPCPLCHAGN